MRPAVVGTAEAAAILATPTPNVTRLRKAGRMPHPVAVLTATHVWLEDDVRALAEDRQATLPARDLLPLLGLAETARLLDRDGSVISRWRRQGRFPATCLELKAGPLWWQEDIERWARERE